MSTTVSDSFVRQYERDVHDLFQSQGAYLLPCVRWQSEVEGHSTTFQRIGKGVATTKLRHGEITPMNPEHSAVECGLSDFYAGDWVDKLDEQKMGIDERQAILRAGAFALGRKVDEQILASLSQTTQTWVTWGAANAAAVRNSLLELAEALDANDVPSDGQRYGALTPRAWAMAMTVAEFSNSDYVGPNGPFTEGAASGERFKDWMGIKWKMHTGLPGKGTAAARVFVWHKNAVGYASALKAGNHSGNSPVTADITWHGDRAAHFVNHMMSGGACLIDDNGVIAAEIDDSAAIPTT